MSCGLRNFGGASLVATGLLLATLSACATFIGSDVEGRVLEEGTNKPVPDAALGDIVHLVEDMAQPQHTRHKP